MSMYGKDLFLRRMLEMGLNFTEEEIMDVVRRTLNVGEAIDELYRAK